MEYKDYIDSDKIKIWPAHNRALQYGYTGYINSEANISELSNNVLHKNSFVIEGCELSKVLNNIHVSTGKVLAGGYIVELIESIDIPVSQFTEGDGIYNLLFSIAVLPSTVTYENTAYDVDTTLNMQEIDIGDTFIWIEKDTESFDTTNAPLLGKVEKQGNDYTVILSKASTSKFDASMLKINWIAPAAGQSGLILGSQADTLQDQFENLTIIDSFGDNVDITENLILTYNDSSTLIINLKQLTNNSSTITLTKSLIPRIESLTSISIPTCVTNIEPGIFSSTVPLTSITVPFIGTSRTGNSDPTSLLLSTLWENRNVSPTLTTFTLLPGPTTITSDAFHVNPSDNLSVDIGLPLVTINLPESVVTLNNNCFLNLEHLRNINIPSNITIIPEKCFENTDLRAVTIPDNITVIKSRAFCKCVNLVTAVIPDTVTTIGSYAFQQCSSLSTISLPNGLITLAEGLFQSCSHLRTLVIPSTVTEIQNNVFEHSGIRQLTLDENITTLGTYIFKDCTSITRIQILSPITTLPEGTFMGCTSIQMVGDNVYFDPSSSIHSYVKLPYTTLRNIGAYAFKGCTSLQKILLYKHYSYNGITNIGDQAFANCTSLVASLWDTRTESNHNVDILHVSSLITAMGEYVFENCVALKNVSFNAMIASSTVDFYILPAGTFAGCTGIHSITVNSSTEDGACLTLGRYSIGESTGGLIGYIGAEAFAGCTGVVSATLSDDVIDINDYAFKGCTSLTIVSVSFNSTSRLSNIGTGAFLNCTALTRVYSGTSPTGNILYTDFPSTLLTIGASAFENTYLQAIYTTGGLTALPSAVFKQCQNLISADIKANITQLDMQSFEQCIHLVRVYLRATSLVTLSNVDVVGSIITFYVPSSLLSSYRSTYPSYTFQSI